MDLIDEDGRLFGLVNIVDALVVLLVGAVVVAGIALVLQPAPEPPAPPETGTTHVTLDLGTQPPNIAAAIAEGDTFSPGENANLTVTNVYRGPSGDGVRVLLGVALRGPATEDTIDYAGAPPRLGRSLSIQTDTYQVSGTIRAIDRLTTTSTSVLVETMMDGEDADRIQEGDTYSIAGTDVGTVESIAVYGTGNPDVRRVLLGLSLQTVPLDEPRFGGTPIREGATVPFRTAAYDATGDIRRVGAAEPRGEPATRTVTLARENVPPEFGDRLQAGMTETIGGVTNTRVIDVTIEPATVVLTSQDGNIYQREHPVNEDVTLTVELRVRETTSGPMFKGRTLQRGSTVTLDLGTTTIEATVDSL